MTESQLQSENGYNFRTTQRRSEVRRQSLPDSEHQSQTGAGQQSHWDKEHAKTNEGPLRPPKESQAMSLSPLPADTDARHQPPHAADESPEIVNIEDLESGDTVIAVFGPTGSGKSTFIRSASGHATHAIGHTLKSCTSEVIAIRFRDKESGRPVVLVDTPGFDNSSKSDTEVLGMISEWLSSSYEKNILLSGILYFHRITDNCMASTPLKNLRVFQELCGKDAVEKVYFTTTMWDEVNQDIGETRLDQLSRDYWKPMIDLGAQIARCRIGDGSSKELIRRILLQKGRKMLLIQQEMVKLEMGLDSAGHHRPNEELIKSSEGPLQAAEEPPVMPPIGDLGPDDIVIAVLGPTGSGKSAFINSASGRDTQGVGHTLKSFTSQVHAVKYWDAEARQHVVLVDTPGFDHESQSEGGILSMVSGWLKSSYDQGKVLSGILYFHRITDNRMAATPLRYLRTFRQLCGKEALEKVYLTTTMWDEVDSEVGEKRLEELRTEYWKPMINHGAHIARCRGDVDPPKELVRRIVFQERERKARRLRQRMIEVEKDLKVTVAGQQLYSQLEKLIEKQSELLRRIAQDSEKAAASGPNGFADLQAEYTELLQQTDDMLGQAEGLRPSRSKNIRRLNIFPRS